MLHTREFDALLSARMSQDECDMQDRRDGARSPRGLIIGLALGASLWAAILAAILALA